jgi:hypothetical protein
MIKELVTRHAAATRNNPLIIAIVAVVASGDTPIGGFY